MRIFNLGRRQLRVVNIPLSEFAASWLRAVSAMSQRDVQDVAREIVEGWATRREIESWKLSATRSCNGGSEQPPRNRGGRP
jgi:hypothetical protein